AGLRMTLDDLELPRRELARLEQDPVGNADLADVVQLARETDALHLVRRGPQLAREDVAVRAHSVQMLAGLLVAELDQTRQTEDRFCLRGPNLLLRELEVLHRQRQFVAVPLGLLAQPLDRPLAL